jgi:hypothetical protein
MCFDCVLGSLRIAQVDPGDEPPFEVVLSQSGSAVVLSLDSSKILKILDPPVLEIRPSSYDDLGSVEQIVTLYIGRKPYCPIWQIVTSVFPRKPKFPRFDQKPDACCAKLFATVFSSLETCCTVK